MSGDGMKQPGWPQWLKAFAILTATAVLVVSYVTLFDKDTPTADSLSAEPPAWLPDLADMRATELTEFPPVSPGDYSTTIDCTGVIRGSTTKAPGTLTSRMGYRTLFEVWVKFEGPAGWALDNTYTDDDIGPGDTGTFSATAHTGQNKVTGCSVVCVNRITGLNHNDRELCEPWADLYRKTYGFLAGHPKEPVPTK